MLEQARRDAVGVAQVEPAVVADAERAAVVVHRPHHPRSRSACSSYAAHRQQRRPAVLLDLHRRAAGDARRARVAAHRAHGAHHRVALIAERRQPAGRSSPGRRRGRSSRPRGERPAAVAQRSPEAPLGRGVEPPEPVEADLQAVQPEPAHLALGGDHAGDERLRRALVGAVRGIRRERDVDLVGDLERDHRADAAEAPDHLAHVVAPGAQVALLARARVIAHLQLDQVAAPGEAASQPEVAPEGGLAVGPEEAVEAQHERPAGRAQARERRVGARRLLGHGHGGRAADLPAWTSGPMPKRSAGPGLASTWRAVTSAVHGSALAPAGSTSRNTSSAVERAARR